MDDPLSICVFFTLHSPKYQDEVVYTSQRVSGSYNPSWESLLFGSTHGRITTFIARVWVSMSPDMEKFNVVYEKIINLPELVYIGTQLNKDISFNPAVGNSFVIGMHEGFYSDGAVIGAPTPPVVSHPLAQHLPPQSLVEVSRNEVLVAYENLIALRLLNRQRALNMAKLKSNRARTEVNTFLLQNRAHLGAKTEKEGLRSRIAVLRQQLIQQKGLEEEEQRALANLRGMQDVVEARLRYHQEDLRREKEHFRDQQLKLEKEIAKLHRVKLNKRMRQNIMIVELCEAFSIKKEGETYTICDVIVPNVDQQDSLQNPDQLGVALGYTAHLVEQLAKVLVVPLPYPLKFNGSKSTVFDHISETFTENIKEFPLYSSSEKWMHRYGTFLLTKDIIQLRLHCGIRTTRQMYKKTLWCLKDLLDRILPPYQPETHGATKQRPNATEHRAALTSADGVFQLRDAVGPFPGERDQSFTPDPPSQASDQPSQLSDPYSDAGFNIDELQNSSAVGEIGIDNLVEDNVRTAGVASFQDSDQATTPSPLPFSPPPSQTPPPYSPTAPQTLPPYSPVPLQTPPPYCSTAPHTPPPPACPNGTHITEERVEPLSCANNVTHQNTPASSTRVEATSHHSEALNRVFDEIFAKRKLNSLSQSSMSETNTGARAPPPSSSSSSSTYVTLFSQEEKTGREVPKEDQQQDSRRPSAEQEACQLEDFIDSPPRPQGGVVTYQSLCEMGECSDQTVHTLDQGRAGGRRRL